jgi:hypothetical protein
MCDSIRSLNIVSNTYDKLGIFAAEIEVAQKRKDWEDYHWKPYGEKEDLFKEDLGNGLMIRLCLGGSLEGYEP